MSLNALVPSVDMLYFYCRGRSVVHFAKCTERLIGDIMNPLGLEAQEAALESAHRAKIKAIRSLRSLLATARELLVAHPDLRVSFANELNLLDSNSPSSGTSTDCPSLPANETPLASEAVNNDPDISSQAVTTPAAGDYLVSPTPPIPPTTVVMVIEYMMKQKGRVVTLNDVLENVKAKPDAIRAVMYKRNKNRFVRTKGQGGQGTFWRLREASDTPTNDEDEPGEDTLGQEEGVNN